MSAADEPLISLRNIAKTYHGGDVPVHALHPLSLDFQRGRFAAIIGQSGSGKSTLLNLLGLLDTPTGGEYWLDGIEVSSMSDNALADIRCHRIGFIFQYFNLFPTLSVLENVCVPLRYAEAPEREIRARAEALLERVGLADRLRHRPNQLSGGQCQRVAIARALANRPRMILADEPTGNLDEETGKGILVLFRELVSEGATILMVTHNPAYSELVDRVVALRDGRVIQS